MSKNSELFCGLSDNVQGDGRTSYAGVEELWVNESSLVNYNYDLVDKLSNFSGSKKDVLEFGAGIGTIAELWASTTGVRPECLEIDEELRKVLTERGFECHESLDSLDKCFDVIYTSNVLEHIDDDVGALKSLHGKIKPGGVIAVYVPAFMLLYSSLDSAVGHYRRYGKKELEGKLKLAGFSIEKCCFVDSLGFFAWLFMKIKGSILGGGFVDGAGVKIYDKYVYPLSKLMDSLGLRFIFGKNLLVIARKS